MSASSGSLPRYILQRLLLVIPMVWILMTMVFLLLRVAPGDPISASLGGKLSPEALENARARYGLDRPLIQQYWEYLTSILHLDFGKTFTDNQPVLNVVRDNGGATASLVIAGFVIAVAIGIPLGLIAGRLRDTVPDVLIRLFGIITYATPIFFVGLLIQVHVAPLLGLPTSGDASAETLYVIPDRTHILLIDAFLSGDWVSIKDVLEHLLLPALTLGIFICGVFIRLVRISILQTIQSDYVEAAQARGISRGKVTRNHAFRNALVPVITVLGLQIALLLGGAVLTETTFNWPGIGQRLVQYINGRDYGAVQGIITVFALVVIFVGLVVDIVNALIDPRVRY
jgi:peptide/nickel transport system permease protein